MKSLETPTMVGFKPVTSGLEVHFSNSLTTALSIQVIYIDENS